MNVWDRCLLDESQAGLVSQFEESIKYLEQNENESNVIVSRALPTTLQCTGINGYKESLFVSEKYCDTFALELESILNLLTDLSSSFIDVTRRTNSLMMNCEHLLEQQHSLQSTASQLREILGPFNDIESVATLLGIPVDASGNPTSGGSMSSTIDPRSSEFQSVLLRLSRAILFCKQQKELKFVDKYQKWLDLLRSRALALVSKSMRDLLSSAGKACSDQSVYQNSRSIEDVSLESAPFYQKFRGLGFRMRELNASLILVDSQESDFEMTTNKTQNSHGTHELDLVDEVKQFYVLLRSELLLPFVKDLGNKYLLALKDSSTPILCLNIRHLFSLLLRISQLELQLFDSLFKYSDLESKPSRETESVEPQFLEVLLILESVCNVVGDLLRPLIIRESEVDELCRMVTTLAEDLRSQINSLRAPKKMIRLLFRTLDRIVSDAQERLSYCAETLLRQQVQMFEPLPSQLEYPEILEAHVASRSQSAGHLSSEDISKSWYPPLRQTLSLLSKLYGVIDMAVFEDFARRSVGLCVIALKLGSEGVRRIRSQLHGDLFLVRHLLILREQLLPFEIRLQGVEKRLDFKPTGVALSNLAANTRSLLRLDSHNGFLQLAWDGLPTILETQVDAKRELDQVLKNSCFSLKQSALKLLLGPLDAFLAKVTAFIGEIPAHLDSSFESSKDISSGLINLRQQSFIRFERIKDVLESVQLAVVQTTPDFRELMKLYVENNVARTILLKPLQQEIELAKHKMDFIIRNCIEASPSKAELEQLNQSLLSSITSELFR